MYGRIFLVFSLALVLVLSLTACSKKQTADTTSDDAEVTETAPVPEPEVEETAMETEPIEDDSMKMPVLDDVFFLYDSAKLSGDAKRMLESNANQIKDASGASITIEGHCDERGTIAYNLALGERRAKAAKDYLVSLGVSAGSVKVISYGKERPFSMGHDESSWSKNRRAHFIVSQR